MAGAWIQVRIKGDREVFAYLKRVSKRADKKGLKLTERIAERIAEKARNLVAPFHTGTGDLKKSIEVLPMAKKGFTVVAGRGLKRPYAWYQEYGYAPHEVWLNQLDPRSNMYKHMMSKIGTGTFKTKAFVSAYHPYMTPAYKSVMKSIDSELNRTANEIIR